MRWWPKGWKGPEKWECVACLALPQASAADRCCCTASAAGLCCCTASAADLCCCTAQPLLQTFSLHSLCCRPLLLHSLLLSSFENVPHGADSSSESHTPTPSLILQYPSSKLGRNWLHHWSNTACLHASAYQNQPYTSHVVTVRIHCKICERFEY